MIITSRLNACVGNEEVRSAVMRTIAKIPKRMTEDLRRGSSWVKIIPEEFVLQATAAVDHKFFMLNENLMELDQG